MDERSLNPTFVEASTEIVVKVVMIFGCDAHKSLINIRC